MAKEPRITLTPTRIANLRCESGQIFLWDAKVPGLAVRATPTKKTYIVQGRLGERSVRISILPIGKITLDEARTEASRLLLLLKQGTDPRAEKRRQLDAEEAETAARKERDAIEATKDKPVLELWQEYIADRRPHWGERHYRDHQVFARRGGVPVKRGSGKLMDGELHQLLALPVADLTGERVEQWLHKQVKARPTRAALAMRLFKAFLNWCGEHEVYGGILNTGILTKRITANIPRAAAKTDCLQKEQLRPWFKAVREISNPVIASYLQVLLLTGARREELAGLRWEDVDFKWKSITLSDKVEATRVIPLTDYCAHLLRRLPRKNKWVFSSPTAASGRIAEPRLAHNKALAVAGIDGLTLHGLRRSFGSLAEWVEMPTGIVAQVMGHKPSATAERHYRVRPLDLLRQWHQKYEDWILEQAGVEIPKIEAGEIVRITDRKRVVG